MNGLRINFYLNYWYGAAPGPQMDSLMANLQKHGVMYLQTGNCFDKYPADNAFLINSSDAYLQDIGSQRGSAGYYTIDECRADLRNGGVAQDRRPPPLASHWKTVAPPLPPPRVRPSGGSPHASSTSAHPLVVGQPPDGA